MVGLSPWLPGTTATSACCMRRPRARASAGVSRALRAPVISRTGTVIAAILAEALPADDERRTLTLVYTAYLALSLTDPALAISPLVCNPVRQRDSGSP